MNIHVDTLEYANTLEKAGIARAHAEPIAKLQAQTVKGLIDHEIVTKDYLDTRLKSELGSLELKLRDEIRSESAKLHDEIRSESAKLRDEMRVTATETERLFNTLMIQIRALQIGAGIAAFAIAAVVAMARMIR